jgi:hypothetical protein
METERTQQDREGCFVKGYDQGVVEVLEEVRKYDFELFQTLMSDYPTWKEALQKAKKWI